MTILQDADAALYQAKADGRGTVRLFDHVLSDRESFRQALRSDLRAAIEDDALRLDFQPIFRLSDGQVSAVEALVRWDRPSHGTLVASEFVPVAESSGLMEKLGEWVLTRALHEARRLPDFVRLAVNVSSLQLQDRRFITHLRRMLESTSLNSKRLELELTETAFFDMSAQTFELLREIRCLGVRINLDDFGACCTIAFGNVGMTCFGALRC